MSTILDQIVASKRKELAQAEAAVSFRVLERRLGAAAPVRDFRAALERPDEVRFLCEVKKASPSAGVLRADFDPVAIARTYELHGAACISVLTDAPFFQGSLAHLSAVREAVALPLLRKDFLIDPYQLLEARVAGADAVLLIAEILDDATLACLLREARGLGLHTLTEIHDEENLPRVLEAGARLVGINNRDLRTFETSLAHTLRLARDLPPNVCLVSESGIRTRDDVLRLGQAGVRAVLVGESLMRSPDIGRKLDELRGIPQIP
ncbi:MAG: indole-3-glycerol phosphate synthase TrpC [Planctomycetes bacterium]|nr:indole-3-glycerol phosphate synthase TrpC [Planctomycetota bacterium]